MSNLRLATLRWAGGLFCALTGALMLIAPHQFSSPVYATLHAHLPWWGTLFLLSGASLTSVAALAPRRMWVLAAHLVTGTAFLLLAWGFLSTGSLSGTVAYATLGVGTLLTLFPRAVSQPSVRASDHSPDLFVIIMGVIAVALGLLTLTAPSQFGSPIYDAARRTLPLYGIALLGSGTALIATSLYNLPCWSRYAVHLLFAVTFWAWMFATALPARAWTGLGFYGGFGLAVALQPLLEPYARTFDPRSLRTRLAVTLAALVAAALILTATLVTEFEERRATTQALSAQRTLALTLSQEVATYVGLHRAAVAALAAQPSLLALPPDEQKRVLQEVQAAYPDMVTFNLYDEAGKGLARSDARPVISVADRPFFRDVQLTGEPVLDIGVSPNFERPRFSFAHPVREGGRSVGVVTGLLESRQLAALLARVGSDEAMSVYLVNSEGRVIAHPDEPLVVRSEDLSSVPPVEAYLRGAGRAGALSYDTASGTLFSSYAAVPGFGWGIVVERPRSVALASTQLGRDLTFVMLLLSIGGAALLGTLLARSLTSPLKTLARLMEQIARGTVSPLPQSKITEIAHLARVFGVMRDRLDAAHTELASQVAELQNTEEALRRANAKLYQGAFYDPLTELPNRTLFMDRLEQVLMHQVRNPERSAAVLFLDFDRFKLVNDSLGHEVGDALLKAIAERLTTCVRPTDTVARLGGDEFTVLVEEVKSVRQVLRVAERIRKAFDQPINLQEVELYTSASIGIVASTAVYSRPNEVVRDADIAMYRAKAKGGASAQVFSRDMHEQVVAAIQLEKELRAAIQAAQFRVVYQPIFAADRRTPVGFEALVRWQHPERGLLDPSAFLSVAEETGLIVEIDRLVWREACRQVRRWQQHSGQPLSLNLNLSSQQFYHPDLLATLKAIFKEADIAPDQVNLELTEGALIDASPGTTGILEALKALGCRLYLDDFGTGYSSLSYLQHFPIDVLKIDRSFVTRLNRDHDSTELVRTIVAMARNLKLSVVAEGVEDETQFAKLRELGCTYTQGYLFAKPLSGEDAAALVAGLGRFEVG